mmetsp:Transcript_32345/g.68030  ORF Transcript_32345/g.68030 Transcript_32345/m.68030 type:complete len:113 (+) Transcript_32345:1110-1448(+)
MFVLVVCTGKIVCGLINEDHLCCSIQQVFLWERGWPVSRERGCFNKQELHTRQHRIVLGDLPSTTHPPRDNYPEAKMPISRPPPTTQQSARDNTSKAAPLETFHLMCNSHYS